jgi:aminoglycoside phosphotransferase (APT) family kinase protein
LRATAGGAAARRVWALIRKLAVQWKPARSLPTQIVHGDIRLANVGRADDGRAAYLDFGFSARRPRVHDVAYSLFWMVLRPDGRGLAEEFAWERLAELIDAYQEGAGWRLEPTERLALLPYLAAVPLYLAAISGYTSNPLEHLLELASSIDIAEWVLSNPSAVGEP